MNTTLRVASFLAPVLVAGAAFAQSPDPLAGAATPPVVRQAPAPATDDPAFGISGGAATTLPIFTQFTGGSNAVDFVAGSGSCGANQGQAIGWQFDVLNPITVNCMTWFDDGLNGLDLAHEVGIWDPAGNLIAATNVVIPAGTAATLDGQWRTMAISPVTLPAGSGYIVGGYNGSHSECLSFNVSQTVHSDIAFVDATFSGLNGIFERPANFSAAVNGFYGVGFQLDGGGGGCQGGNGVDFVPGSGTCGTNQGQSIGWQFNVLSPITVNAMTWFDDGQDGLQISHEIGIWDPAGTLIAATNVTIPAGTTATLDGIWRTVSIAPTLLPVGNGYIVGGYNGTHSECLSANVTQTVNPSIAYVDATFSGLNGIFERPSNFSSAVNGFYGCGFQIDDGNCGATLHCDPANNHSGGTYATLADSSVSGPGVLHLEATDGPAGEFGYFLVSLGFTDPGTPISNGMLCLTSPIGRYAPAAGGALNSIGQFDGAGVLQNLAGTSTVGSGYDVMATLPTPPGGVIAAGTSYYFQCWFRDGNRSNFSNVLQFQ